MSVTLESLDAKLDSLIGALIAAGYAVQKPDDGLGLQADRFTADGAYAFEWLDEVWARVQKHGTPDPKAPEGTRRIIVATATVGRNHQSVKAVEVPQAIMARPLIEAALAAGITLDAQQQYNIIMSDTRSAFMMGATFGPGYRFANLDPYDFRAIPGVWSLRVGQNRVTAEDIKPRLLEGVAQQCALAGIAVDLSGI
jgi:hypothetical protein